MVRSLIYGALVSVVAGLGFVNQQLFPGADFRSEVVNPDLTMSPNIIRGASCIPPSDGLITRIIALNNNAFVETILTRQLVQAADKVIPVAVGTFELVAEGANFKIRLLGEADGCLEVDNGLDQAGQRILIPAAPTCTGVAKNTFKIVPTTANKFVIKSTLPNALNLEVSGGGKAGTDVVTAVQTGAPQQEFCLSTDNGVSCIAPVAAASGRLYVSHTGLPLRLATGAKVVRLGDSGATQYTTVQLQVNNNGFSLTDVGKTQAWDGTATDIVTSAFAANTAVQRFIFQSVPGKSNVFYIMANDGKQLEVDLTAPSSGGVNSKIKKSSSADPNAPNQQFCFVGLASAITFTPGSIPNQDFYAPLERYIGRLYPIGLVEEYLPLPGWFGCDPQIDDVNGFDVTDLRRGDNNGQLNAQVTCVVTNVPARDMSVNTPLRTDNSMINPQWWLGKRVLVQSQAGCRNVRLNGLNSIIACPLGALRGVFNTVVGNGNRAYPGTAHLRSRFNGNQWEVFPVRNSFLDFALGAATADDAAVTLRNRFRWINSVGNARTEDVANKLSDDNQAAFRINA